MLVNTNETSQVFEFEDGSYAWIDLISCNVIVIDPNQKLKYTFVGFPDHGEAEGFILFGDFGIPPNNDFLFITQSDYKVRCVTEDIDQ